MNDLPVDDILNKPICTLSVSPTFLSVCARNNFESLTDLLPYHMSELLAFPGMNYALWNEYAAFLEGHGLGHYLDQSEPNAERAAH